MAYKRRLRFDKRIKFQKKMNIIYILLLIVLASIGTGYAYIKSNLNINGTANVMKANWDVHFDNLQVTTGSVTASSPATITDDTTVEFSAELAEPGDYYEFTVDVANDGTMDAMIDNFSISPTLTTAQQKYLEYTVSYSDGTPLANKQELKANTSENLKVRFSYIENSDKTNYPTSDQSFNIVFSVDYIQADGSEIEVDHPRMVYTANVYNSGLPNNNAVIIGQAIPNSINVYSDFEDAVDAVRYATSDNGVEFCLKHKIEHGIVTESYVEFEVPYYLVDQNSNMTMGIYSLKGGDSGISYAENRATMLTAFGSSNCGPNSCVTAYLDAWVNSNGYVDIGDGQTICKIDENGYSLCT